MSLIGRGMMVAAFALMGVLAGQSVQAQDTAGGEKAKASESAAISDTKKMDRENMQQLVHDVLAARLARELELDDAETVTLIRRFDEYRAQLGALQKKRQETLKALKAGIKANASEKEMGESLATIQDLDRRVQELRKGGFEKIGEGMSISRKARLYVFYNDFETEMRKLVQKAREKTAQRKKVEGEEPATREKRAGQAPQGANSSPERP